MYVDEQTIAVLTALAENDFTVVQTKKKLELLPQRSAIITARKQLEELNKKLKAVEQLEIKARNNLETIENSYKKLQEMEEKARNALEMSGKNFREAEVRNKELRSIEKQQRAEANNHDKTTAELDKIVEAKTKIETIIKQIQAKEQSETDSFIKEGTELKNRIAYLDRQHSDFIGELPSDLGALYEKTAQLSGGIALAKLENKNCSVCRGELDKAHILQLRKDGPLGTCPLCRRLLLVQD